MRSKVPCATTLKLTALGLGLALLWATGAWAQTTPPNPQFFFTGFVQEATLDTTGAICTPAAQGTLDVSRLRGGTLTVNGIQMIVPCNTLMQLPAATMMWADLFDPLVSAPVGTNVGSALPAQALGQTRLALADNPMPFPSFAVSVSGNVVGKNADGTDKYIVGLIAPIEQQVLNGSSGIVSCIDYTNGSFRVGGIASTAVGGACPTTGATGALVQFNDPISNAGPDGTSGRWGLTHSPDPRFTGDDANTTIHTSTGFPLCIPRVAPPSIDTECPIGNRPLNGDTRFPVDPFLATGTPLKIFDMPCPAGTLTCPAGAPPQVLGYPDPTKQVPLMVGDQVLYIGTIFKINPLATLTVTNPDGTTSTIPDNTAANTYMSAHTVESVLGIFTQPGIPPAYISIEEMLIGAGGAPVLGILQEASTRMTVVGFTSDPTRLVDIYAQDVNPCTGQVTLRGPLATTDPAADAIKGRFVHRVLGGLFGAPTRNYTIRSRTQALDPLTGLRVEQIVANGIIAGEFSLPIFEYIFPENHRLGDPFIPNNYQDLPFLALGSGPIDGPLSGTAVIGQLDPWPSNLATNTPAPVNCSAFGTSPVVTIIPSTSSVGTGGQVVLTGNVVWDLNSDPALRTTAWAQTAGTPVTLVPDPANPLRVSFIAPSTPGLLSFTLTATDNTYSPALTGSFTANVNVLQPTDVVQIVVATWAEQKGKRGPFGKVNATASSTDVTAILTLLEAYDSTVYPDSVVPPGCGGGVCTLGTGTTRGDGIYDWVEIKGLPAPTSFTVNSNKGGLATQSCGQPNGRGTITCP